jgi:hypothetical protein
LAVEDGFGAVLKIDSRNVSALTGLGDAHLAAAKVLANGAGEVNARKHLQQSVNSYSHAVTILKAGECQLSYNELLLYSKHTS